MKKTTTIITFVLCLAMFLLPIYLSDLIPQNQARAQEGKEVKITLHSAPFGSIVYGISMGIEALSRKQHPWLRLAHVEGLGATGNTKQLLTNPSWKDSIIITSDFDILLAQKGAPPFKKPIPDASKRIKFLSNMAFIPVTFYTFDPSIKTEKDLKGKKVALGRVAQTAWGKYPTILLKELSPELDIKLDYLSPKRATQALIQGKADAAVVNMIISPDFKPGPPSVVAPSSPLQDMLASGKPFHYITISKEGLSRLNKAYPTNYIEFPSGTFPGEQLEPITAILLVAPWGVLESFPEELAYEFTKFYIQIAPKLPNYHATGKALAKPAALSYGLKEENTHPGAVRAFREVGLWPPK